MTPAFFYLLLLAMVLLPTRVWAHGLTLVPPDGIWYAWSFDPLVLVPLLLTHWLYGRGVLKLWRQAGAGRGIRRSEAACFLAGELTLVLALIWPFDALGGTLFSGHMVQHMLLMVVAPPLLVIGRPLAPVIWALPEDWRPRSPPRPTAPAPGAGRALRLAATGRGVRHRGTRVPCAAGGSARRPAARGRPRAASPPRPARTRRRRRPRPQGRRRAAP